MAGYFQVATTSLIYNPKTKLYLALLKPKRDKWTLPGGRLEQGEDINQAMKREIHEETGLLDINIENIMWAYHGFRGEGKTENELIVLQYFVTTNQIEIKLSTEHIEYKWMSLNDLVNNLSESLSKYLLDYAKSNPIN